MFPRTAPQCTAANVDEEDASSVAQRSMESPKGLCESERGMEDRSSQLINCNDNKPRCMIDTEDRPMERPATGPASVSAITFSVTVVATAFGIATSASGRFSAIIELADHDWETVSSRKHVLAVSLRSTSRLGAANVRNEIFTRRTLLQPRSCTREVVPDEEDDGSHGRPSAPAGRKTRQCPMLLESNAQTDDRTGPVFERAMAVVVEHVS